MKKGKNISQSNELTEAAYYLPLQAKRVLWLCLVQSYKTGKTLEEFGNVFTITVADYQQTFECSLVGATNDVKKGVNDLLNNSVTFEPKDGDFVEMGLPWLARAGLKVGRGKWQIEFNHYIMPYLHGLSSQFTTFSLFDCRKLNSARVIRLYESLCQFRESGTWKTSHAILVKRFKLPASQRDNVAEMRRTFLSPALKKINAHTPLKAGVELLGDGALIFTIVEK